jgi:hypothetical protein
MLNLVVAVSLNTRWRIGRVLMNPIHQSSDERGCTVKGLAHWVEDPSFEFCSAAFELASPPVTTRVSHPFSAADGFRPAKRAMHSFGCSFKYKDTALAYWPLVCQMLRFG